MKDAYGGTFSLWVFMIFFVIYVTFIGVALNFAKIYRIKNNVINILEEQQYSGVANDPALDQMEAYLKSVPYSVSNDIATAQCQSRYGSNDFKVDNGVCIIPMPNSSDPQYYRVEVYFVADFSLNFPGFGDISLTIPASGETKIIYQSGA